MGNHSHLSTKKGENTDKILSVNKFLSSLLLYNTQVMSGILVSLLICLLASQAQAQITEPFKSCPQVETKANFDLSKYMGRWYEIEKYPNWFEKGSCNGAEYKLKPEGGVAVINSEVLDNGKLNFAIGQARQDPSSNIASHLQVRFSKWQPWGQYLVLDTDYDSFTVVYSCTNLLVTRLEFLWIMSRERTLSTENMEKIYTMLKGYGIKPKYLEAANQDEELCKVLP